MALALRPDALLTQQNGTAQSVPLTDDERNELNRCEQIFADRTRPFYEWGRALSIIQKGRLFRGSHKTFEVYCGGRWQIHRSYAYRLMKGAEVIECLMPIGDIPLPTTEAQVRPLTHVGREMVSRIWKQAFRDAGDKEVTANHVMRAIGKFVSGPKRKSPVFSQHNGTPVMEERRKSSRLDSLGVPSILEKKKVRLSEREEEIISCAIEGMTNKQIAEVLSCSTSTVRSHFEHIFVKYGAHSRPQAVAIFLREHATIRPQSNSTPC